MNLQLATTRPVCCGLFLFGACALFVCAAQAALTARAVADDAKSKPAADIAEESPDAPHHTATLRGRVVWLADALQRRFDVKTVPEAAERILALETPEGDLHPLIEDVRSRAFRRDERLRNIEVELLVRRYEGAPLAQIIRVFEIRDDGKYELDYWCEICAIAMYELKACDCCQGPIELRRRKAEDQ